MKDSPEENLPEEDSSSGALEGDSPQDLLKSIPPQEDSGSSIHIHIHINIHSCRGT